MSTSIKLDLTKIIRCPVTKSVLTEANPTVIAQLNQQIESGKLINRTNQIVELRLDAGFINADQSLLFPVSGGILILTEESAIPLDGLEV